MRETGNLDDVFHFSLVLQASDGEIWQVVLQVTKAQALRSAGGSAKVGENGTRKSPGPGLEGWLAQALNPGVTKRIRPPLTEAGPAEQLVDRIADHMVSGEYMTQTGGNVHRQDVIRMTVDLAEALAGMKRTVRRAPRPLQRAPAEYNEQGGTSR